MSIQKQGILDAFTGTVGPVTGYLRYGRNILRSSSSATKARATPLRMAQREKIRICNQFTKAFSGSGFFSKSFPAYGQGSSGYNRATGTLMNLAIAGVYPDMQLNYSEVMIFKGSLPGAQNAKAVKNANNIIQISFSDNSIDGIAAAGDTVILVAYAPDLRQAVFTLNAGSRKDKKAVLNVATFKGHTIEIWIGFLSADEKDASDSVWTGRIVV